MGQIVKRKKKGRPSKADLARREPPDLRRSIRRRNVRYTFDYDDYIDDEEEDDYEEEEEDDRRREKKLELLIKLQVKESRGTTTAESTPSQTRRVSHAPSDSPSSSDYGGGGSKPLKKRKIDGDDETQGDVDEDDEEEEEEIDVVDEVQGRKSEQKGAYSVPGTPSDVPSGVSLPDKKTLELILDKLQKKDIYGVYAEPVDPEELPDYHDVIKRPMDFATVRRKLGNGKYTTLEQFESDVFLICTNAMQYNAPDTIYHKQAFSIQELAKRKFERLRIEMENSEKELKSEHKTRSSSLPKMQIKKPMSRTLQEPVGSDFSSGATLPTAGDTQNGSSAPQAGGCEKPAIVDGLIEGNASFIDSNLDKGEELQPGKGLLPRVGRKPPVQDENRRATYHISNQPIPSPESIFTTFEGEIKQLVPVGLHADHSYARSLARFAASLGSAAWKVAAQRIEQALPAETKFGRGWVGEYEPLPTPVLMIENCTLKKPAFFKNSQCTNDASKDDKVSTASVSAREHPFNLEGKSPLFGKVGTGPITTGTSSLLPAKEAHIVGKQSVFSLPGNRPTESVSVSQQQNLPARIFVEPDKKVSKQVELNGTPLPNQSRVDFAANRQVSSCSELPDSKSIESISRNRNLSHSVSFKQPDRVVATGPPKEKAAANSFDANRMVTSSPDNFINPIARAANYFPHGQEYSASDPVQLMRILTEKAQNQQKSSKFSMVDVQPVVPPVPSLRREDSGNAATAAARAWMSIGAGGFKPENTSIHKNQVPADFLYNPNRDRQPQVSRSRGEYPVSQMQFQPDANSFPLHAFVPPHVRIGNEAQLQNQHIMFPQLVTADLSRVQGGQSLWRGPQVQLRQKQELLPPDLNIGFQPTGSPVRQSSSVLVDSQQPDLALQL
ncbi:hypothetical protein LguiA_035635 [Lonicera macranthoides]